MYLQLLSLHGISTQVIQMQQSGLACTRMIVLLQTCFQYPQQNHLVFPIIWEANVGRDSSSHWCQDTGGRVILAKA
jgi:hypothetical protein